MAGMGSGMNLEVFKLPLGFIRVVQLPVVIIAFATACDYSGHFIYNANKCNKTTTVDWSYPFNLPGSQIPTDSCVEASKITQVNAFSQSYASSAQFFVFVAVVTFLWILASVYVYAARWSQYESDPRLAKGDFIFTAVLALCWICGWIAWAAAVDGIKGAVSEESVYHIMGLKDASCKPAASWWSPADVKSLCLIDDKDSKWGTGHLTISALAGFACVVAVLGNLWFVWKETEWNKLRQATTDLNQIPGTSTPATPTGRPYDPNSYNPN